MEIILSKNCQSITGTISRKHGYYIKNIKGRFYGVRKSRGMVPPDGHLHFIICLAHMAVNSRNLYISDISVPSLEIVAALDEANFPPSAITVLCVPGHVYNAREIVLLECQLNKYVNSCNHES